MIIQCNQCGKNIDKTYYQAHRHKNNFCSKQCYHKSRIVDPVDFINKTFGSYKVLEIGLNDKWGKTRFKCQCKCGNITLVYPKVLNSHIGNVCKKCANRKFETVGKIFSSFFVRLINGAKSRNLKFEITQQDIWDKCVAQDHKCALSGLELTYKDGKEDCSGTASVDRKISTQGYTKENIQIVHKDINFMKQDYSDEYYLKMCEIVTNYQKDKK